MEFVLDIERDTKAIRAAREAVRGRLRGLVAAPVLDDVVLAVSEMVTNAVVHGRGDIVLRMQVDDRTIRGEVVDEGTGFENEIRERGMDTVGGRGLRIVAQVADRWGVHEGTTHVWFEVARGGASDVLEEPELGDGGDRGTAA